MQSVVLTTARPLDRALLARVTGVEDLVCEGPTAMFRTATTSRSSAELMQLLDEQGGELTELRVRKATLEDVFIALTAGASVEAP
jgi:hypothetical protein